MSSERWLPLAACLLVAASASAAPPQRTFVSTSGVDNPACSLGAPCRGFAAAITAVADQGEVVVLDSGGYGPFTADKSVIVTAPAGVYAGISVFTGNNGVTIATAGVHVTLRGLAINGQGTSTNGIVMTSGTALTVERTQVTNVSGNGIDVTASGATVLLADVTVSASGTNGIRATGPVELTGERVRVEGSANIGVLIENGAHGVLRDSVVTKNAAGMFCRTADAVSRTRLEVDSSVISHNGGDGIVAVNFTAGGVAEAVVARSTISHNTFGASATAGSSGVAIITATDNLVAGNTSTGIQGVNTNGIAVASRNTVVRNGTGVSVFGSGVVKTRQDNTVENNTTADVAGVPSNIIGK